MDIIIIIITKQQCWDRKFTTYQISVISILCVHMEWATTCGVRGMIFEISLSYSFSMMSGISSAFQNLETILCIKIAWCSLLIIMFLFMQKLAYDICWYKKKITRKQVYACCRKPLSWWLSNSEVTPLLTNWSLALSNRSGWFTFYHHCCGENFLVS